MARVVSVEVVVNDDGTWDEDTTVQNFALQLATEHELYSKDQTVIQAILDDNFKGGVKYNKPAMVTAIMGKIWDGNTATHNPLRERIEEVIDSNSHIYTVKGPGGGTFKMSDEDYSAFEKDGLNPHARLAFVKKEAELAKLQVKAKLKAMK